MRLQQTPLTVRVAGDEEGARAQRRQYLVHELGERHLRAQRAAQLNGELRGARLDEREEEGDAVLRARPLPPMHLGDEDRVAERGPIAPRLRGEAKEEHLGVWVVLP